MAFTKALYYPSIDIKDESWLKNAMLYWENIQTIVPSTIKNPYSTETAQEFHNQGLLQPLYVKPSMRDINELTDCVMKYLESQEGAEVIRSNGELLYSFIHIEKLSPEIRELVEVPSHHLPYVISKKIENDDWIRVDSRFADFYMTMLATHLSKNTGAGLLTNIAATDKLATAVKLDARLDFPTSRRDDSSRSNIRRPVSLAQGALADLIFEKIQIDPDTPVEKILEFRRDHDDELGRFRTKIAELTNTISSDKPLDTLRQEAQDIYKNEVKPGINSLKENLTDSNINWVIDNFLKVSLFSASSTSILPALLGLSVPQALLVGVGISLTVSAIRYNREKARELRQNPFSYLLAAERNLVTFT